MFEFDVVGRPAEGMVLMNIIDFGDVYHGQLWARCKAHKENTCDATGVKYKPGTWVYRPVGNASNHSRRVLAWYVDGTEVQP